MKALVITPGITNRESKSLEKYLNEVARYDVLSPEEELNLFKQYRNGDKTVTNKIVRANLRFVISVAKRYQHCGLSLNDLINEGNLGLMEAVTRFDETRGFKFISYAVWWIRQSMIRAINKKGSKIREPQNQQNIRSKVYRAQEELMQKYERSPKPIEIARHLDLDRDAVTQILEDKLNCRSLDAPIKDGETGTLKTLTSDHSIPSPDSRLTGRESLRKEVGMLINQLNHRESTVLRMYFGIGQKRSATLQEISERLDVGRERVRQIKDRALRRINRYIIHNKLTFSYA